MTDTRAKASSTGKPTLQRASDHERSIRNQQVAGAHALRPLLQKNAVQTDKDRRVVEENITAMKDAGLFRLMVPKRYGGYQVSMRTNLDVITIIAEGCGASAWVLNLINHCAGFIGLREQHHATDLVGRA